MLALKGTILQLPIFPRSGREKSGHSFLVRDWASRAVTNDPVVPINPFLRQSSTRGRARAYSAQVC